MLYQVIGWFVILFYLVQDLIIMKLSYRTFVIASIRPTVDPHAIHLIQFNLIQFSSVQLNVIQYNHIQFDNKQDFLWCQQAVLQAENCRVRFRF